MEEIEEIKLSDDVFEQIKDFNNLVLTEEQELLIDKLILNEELKNRYKYYGLCKECKQPGRQSCNAKHPSQNFKSWTSGNHNIDEFIQNAQLQTKNGYDALKWIEYDRFVNVEYLARGGFGIIYKANWKDGFYTKNQEGLPVALKCLRNSQDVTIEFLKEIDSHLIMNHAYYIATCYGITKDPKTNDFIMVMDYAENGSLRKYLDNNFNSLDWKKKLQILFLIACGLNNIHNRGLIHQDFHCGNVLSCSNAFPKITDLGLCQPSNANLSQSSDKKIYGVLPYVAPEVLRGKEYTQASDIYGFGIIAYEICTGLPPYHDISHNEFLSISICQGLRPKSNYKIPQLILCIIEQCWDANPLKRPNAGELYYLLRKFYYDKGNSLINKQIKEADEINKWSTASASSSANILSYKTHSQAVYTSRLLDFKNLPEPKNADYSFEPEYSESIRIDFTKLDTDGNS